MQLSVQTEISFLISSISIQTYRTYLQSGSQNDLLLNVSKTKEMIGFFREKVAKTHTAVYIRGAGEMLEDPGNQYDREPLVVTTLHHPYGTFVSILTGNHTNWHGSSRLRTGSSAAGD